jgi:hypothetical protein
LFAALDVASGKVIGECLPRHRSKEFIKFLKKIDEQTLPYLDLHLIVDNYATHKTPAVQRWLKRHPRFKLHLHPHRRTLRPGLLGVETTPIIAVALTWGAAGASAAAVHPASGASSDGW